MVETKPDPVEQALSTLKPVLSKLTFGSFMGYCSGYASKKLGKAIAVTIGLGFIAVQGMVATGYISIDWMKVKDDAIKAVDTVRLAMNQGSSLFLYPWVCVCVCVSCRL